MKVFLTGSTGYIGSVVAEKLQQSGHTVVGLARSEESARRLSQPNMTFIYATIDQAQRLAEAASDADITIHTAASREPQAAQWEQAAVAAMLGALAGTNKTFVYTSGASVVGDTGDQMLDETAPTNLANWRAALEQTVLNASEQQVRAVVIRPSFVYGRAGGILARLVAHAHKTGVAGYVQPGTNQWSFIHVDDLADLYRRAAESAPAGAVYNAAAEHPVEMRAIAESMQRSVGAASQVEGWTLETALSVIGPIAHLLTMNVRVSGDKARHALGWLPQAPSVFDELERGSYAAEG